MGVRTWEPSDEPPPAPLGPSIAAALSLSLLVFLALVSNGRPDATAQTQAAERLAADLAEGSLEPAPGTPLLPSLLAAPVFMAARAGFALDETGRALAGKLAASLLSALGAGALFLAVGRRRPHSEAAASAALFALGTGVWSASQALWPQAAALPLLCLAVLCVVRAEYEPRWASLAGLPLGLAAAADPSAWALAGVLWLGLAGRWPRHLPGLTLAALPGVALAAFGPDPATLLGGAEPTRVASHLALLVSPAKGWLVFTPLVVVAAAGLIRGFRRGERWLAASFALAVLAHWLFVGHFAGWHGGAGWGPRPMSDALPFLMLWLPEGLDALGRAARLLAAASLAVQALGAFGYEPERWERLHGPAAAASLSWDVARSPLALQLSERVLRPAVPALREGRAVIREHPLVVLGERGSRISFGEEHLVVSGADQTCRDVHLQGGARVHQARLILAGPADALFLRVTQGARLRPLELRLSGRGRGTLRVSEQTFWSDARVTSYALAGSFRFRHAYDYPESGGPDIRISVEGEASLEAVSLLAPGAPDQPLEIH